MTHTFCLGHDYATGDLVPIFSDSDFVRMIEERLGRDSANYVAAIIIERDLAKGELIKSGDYDNGFDDGKEEGYVDGWNDGFKKGVQEVLTKIKNIVMEY